MKKIVLLAFMLVLFSTVMSLCVVAFLGLRITYALPYTDITVETAYNMITNGSYPDLVILDVRRQDEYDTGHIYGAVWIPHTELETRISELAGHENHEIIVYCRTGVRSVNASETLDSYNFTKVYNMLGGITEWQSTGYQVWIATIHNVNTTFNYDTIQAAIDAPQTLGGHTIYVDAGIYYENVVVNKSISFIGGDKDTTIIDGNKTGDVIEVRADNVTISGFTIRNGDVYGWHAGWGVYIRDSSGCKVSGNNVTDNKGGICVEYSSSIQSANCTIRENMVNNNFEGISLYRSDNCTVTRNNVTNSRNSGIYLFASSYCTITGNQIENTQSYGIYLRYLSNNNTIHHNNLIDNGIQASVSNLMSHPRNNTWDNGLEGNYWSDYEERYPNATEADGSGIWDTPYEIDQDNVDRYPIVPEFPTLTSMLFLLIVLTVVLAIYKQRLLKIPNK